MIASIIILSVVLFDLFTKYLTVQILIPVGGEVVVIPKLLNFCYVENTGAAFGILKDHRWIFMTLSILLISFVFIFLIKSRIKHVLFILSTSFILGGGIGNMIDRVFVGYVVDFIKVTFIDFPVFNIADSAVVVGAILLAVYFIFFDKSYLTNNDKL